MEWLWVAGALLAGVAIFAGTYADLARTRRQCDAAWEELRKRMGKRHDRVAELGDALRTAGVLAGERLDTLGRVLEECVGHAAGLQEQARAERTLNDVLKPLAALVKDSAELNENEDLRKIPEQLTAAENAIRAAALAHNEAVRKNNHKVHYLPWCLFAAAYGFRERERFGL